MAVKIHSGMLNKSVVFKQPISSLNNEGGEVITHEPEITTRACVVEAGRFRRTQLGQTYAVGEKDFYVRYASDRAAIKTDWLIEYKSQDYVINEIEQVEEKEVFIRFTGKLKTNG